MINITVGINNSIDSHRPHQLYHLKPIFYSCELHNKGRVILLRLHISYLKLFMVLDNIIISKEKVDLIILLEIRTGIISLDGMTLKHFLFVYNYS